MKQVKSGRARLLAGAIVGLAALILVDGGAATGQSAPDKRPLSAAPQEVVTATWTPLPGKAVDLSINAAAIAYAVQTDGVALRWRAARQNWAKMSGNFVRISAAEGNRPWGVTPDGGVMRFNGLWWETKGDKVADVAGDALGNVFIARQSGVIEKWEPLSQSWRPVPGPKAMRIALDILGNPWVVTPEGRIYRREAENWISMPGLARDIALGADGSAAIVDGNRRLRVLRRDPLRWVLYEGVTGVVAVALTPNGGPWVALADGRIFATVLIRDEVPLTEEDQDKAQTPHATVPEAPTARAQPAVAPQIQTSKIQANSSQANTAQAADAQAKGISAQGISTSSSGGQSGGGDGGSGQSSGSVSPSSGGGLTDQAGTSAKGKLDFVDTRATASQIAIGRDGSVFALDTSGGISRWSNGRKQFESFPGQLARIAVDSQGNPWGVTGRGRVFRHDGIDWRQVQGVTGSDIAIGTRDDVVVLADAQGLLSKYNASTGRFDRISGLGVQVAVDKNGAPWTIRSDQVVQRCDRSPCSSLFKLARSIAIGPDGTLFIVTTNDQLLRKRENEKSFEQILVPGHTPAQVAVGPNGYPWVVTSARKVLATKFFERDESGDRVLAQKSSGNTGGSGATASVVASQSSSAFTFTKNLKWETYKSTDPDANMAMLNDVHAGHTGAVFISGDSGVFKFNSKTKKFESLTKSFSTSSIADVGEDESGTLWALGGISPAKVYRIKGTQEKVYTVINNTDTPRNLAVTADGTVYVAAGQSLYKMEAGGSVFKKIVDEDVFFVHVGPGGDLWIMNQNSRVQQYTGTKFENRPKGTALQAQDMAVGADGSVYVIQNSDSLLKKWNASNGRFDDVNITQTMERVTVDIDGRPWLANTSGGLTSTGDIWRAKD